MKKIIVIFLLTLLIISCQKRGCECIKGDSYHWADDPDDDYVETRYYLTLLEYCDERGCNNSTGKCNVWTDPDSGLTWSSLSEWNKPWDDAVSYCEKLHENGHHDWRLPTIEELESLLLTDPESDLAYTCQVSDTCLSYDCWSEEDCYIASGNKFNKNSATYWSSSELSDKHDKAWVFALGNNRSCIYSREKYKYTEVRCVR